MTAVPSPDPTRDRALPLAAGAPLLTTRHLRRTFGETVALDDCSFEIAPGEIHALVGENGSGKSTLTKTLSGIIRPDSGEILWNGVAADLKNPWAAQHLGIGTVFQEILVLDALSVRDNIMLGVEQRVIRKYAVPEEVRRTRAVLDTLGLVSLDTEVLVETLPLAERQLIGIARSLVRPWRLLILDESTSALDVEDRDRLFAVLRGYRDEGRSILFVSHRMDEIESLVERSTVLRSGRSVATLRRAESPTERLLELMSSKQEAQAASGHAAARPAHESAVVVAVRFPPRLAKPSHELEVRAGEILGLAGLEGHGQAAMLEWVAGLRRPASGEIRVGGVVIQSARGARRNGVAFLPRDRKSEGIFGTLSVVDNIMASSFPAFSSFGLLAVAQLKRAASALVASMKVKTAGLAAPITSLSGGNQQKVLLGRLMATNPKVLVLNDPMRGVDLGAKRDLYEVLTTAADQGITVLLNSTELVELCLLCDRVAVFHDQAMVQVLTRDRLSEHALIEAMFGRSSKDAGGTL